MLILGNKGYSSAAVAASLRQTAGVTLFTVPRAAAHTLCVVLDRRGDTPDLLRLKHLVFSN